MYQVENLGNATWRASCRIQDGIETVLRNNKEDAISWVVTAARTLNGAYIHRQEVKVADPDEVIKIKTDDFDISRYRITQEEVQTILDLRERTLCLVLNATTLASSISSPPGQSVHEGAVHPKDQQSLGGIAQLHDGTVKDLLPGQFDSWFIQKSATERLYDAFLEDQFGHPGTTFEAWLTAARKGFWVLFDVNDVAVAGGNLFQYKPRPHIMGQMFDREITVLNNEAVRTYSEG